MRLPGCSTNCSSKLNGPFVSSHRDQAIRRFVYEKNQLPMTKPLTADQRREVFRTLVEMQDQGTAVDNSKTPAAAQFSIEVSQLEGIETGQQPAIVLYRGVTSIETNWEPGPGGLLCFWLADMLPEAAS